MTVRANRTQLVDWIDLVRGADGGELSQVMDVDEPAAKSAVGLLEIEPTHTAGCAVVGDPGAASSAPERRFNDRGGRPGPGIDETIR